MHKRIVGRIPKLNGAQHRNLSLDSNNGSHNIPEQVSLEQESMEADGHYETLTQVTSNTSISQLDEKTSPKIKSPDKKMSKSSILRNLFFLQNDDGPSKS